MITIDLSAIFEGFCTLLSWLITIAALAFIVQMVFFVGDDSDKFWTEAYRRKRRPFYTPPKKKSKWF